eukprot:2896748-Pleurochrysis_carterae.AAC.1
MPGQRASAANALSVTGAVALWPGERLGAAASSPGGRLGASAEPSAVESAGSLERAVSSGELSKKGSDARAAGIVPWNASRTAISRRRSSSMRRC